MKTASDLEFEEWAKSQGLPRTRYFAGYLDPITQAASLGWKARDAKIIELSEKLKELEK